MKRPLYLADKAYRICLICYEAKELTDYHKHPQGAQGLHPYCKACRNDSNWQSQLLKRLDNGDKSVHSCTKCDRLISSRKKVCKKCLS